MTRALISGGSGFVGSWLLDFLISNTNWDAHILLRPRSPLDNIDRHIKRINTKDRIFVHYGDLNDQGSLTKVVYDAQPDYIFHLAAQSFPGTSFTAPIDTLNTNILGTCRLLEAIKACAPKALTHICASSEVFGRVSEDKLPINEECSFHPASPYAISKIGTDLIGRYYAESFGMHVQTTRMFTHTGPRRGDVFAESSFAKQIAMIEAGRQEPVIKVGNRQSLRTFADVRDAVRAYHMLLTVNPLPGAYYNIGGTHTCTIGQMLEKLCSFARLPKNFDIEIDLARLRPIDATLQVPDTRKFSKHTGWVPEISFEQTMLDLLNYWRERVKKYGNQLNR